MESTIQPPAGAPDIQPVSIVTEMRTSFLDYAMSVIVARALPDVRDGLKPVHRRILWGSHENGFTHNKPYRKSARIVGDVMGKYHPHGDSAIYDALARMTQDWSMRLPLIDGQGNFGSMDPDAPAAMRYTEARLAKSADALLADIDKDTVDFVPNYDGSEHEPSVLPARFPNLLVNGAGGIAVGMATNIPPHNLGEVVDAVRAYLDDPLITVEGLMAHVPAPDFPTGGLILGSSQLRAAYETGRGSIRLRARHEIEEGRGDKRAIVLTEIPYQQGKNALVEKIAEAVKDKRIEGVSDLRDESNREGVRIVLDLKRDATPDVVLNQLWRYTPAQQSFAINMLAIRGGRPELMGLKDIISAFVEFRETVITRRSKHELMKARERAHLLIGLVIAVANLDEVVRIIRASASPADARETLMARDWDAAEIRPYLALVEAGTVDADAPTIRLTEAQVRAILDLRLQKLTALGRDEIGNELKELADSIADLLDILTSRVRLRSVLRAELDAVSDEFQSKRRTEIVTAHDDIDDEDLIEREDMVVTVTRDGWIKRVALAEYRAQGRGGKGRNAMGTKDEDAVTTLFVTSTHNPVLFFSTAGKVYRLKVWRLPQGSPQAKGKPINNLLPLAEGETIITTLALPEDEAEWGRLHVMFATAHGSVRRNAMDAFTSVPTAGKLAIRFEDGPEGTKNTDRLIGVALCDAADDVFLAAKSGKAIRFAVDDVREFVSRTSTGVRGMTLADGDEVVSMAILKGFEASTEEREDYLKAAAWKSDPGERILSETRMGQFAAAEEFILTITANGFGKRSSAFEYRQSGRGGQGIRNIGESDRNGDVVASFTAHDDDDVMLVTDQAKLIRIRAADIRIMGRAAQGVTLFKVADDEHVVSAALIPADGEDAATDGAEPAA
ncbi:DNA gyrase subunit A [Sandarakinorhabdus cyanobacteriorum]|uniref:DNA gyrase subunit A n=1 Tax=Sandarakinorhabdus cyanobacteriorum TaxID=1981098 RepID=A0A255YDE1_9SPHN|nr:DNA gyrase subunit A [Sandarakinorhabdus cyanobacteriorum]OYQ27219.1 DNA gyrase subunit A [Sandarakinorhabdus cyanobacteriorum]